MDLPKHLCGEPTRLVHCFLQPNLQSVAASGKLCGTSKRVCCNMTKQMKTETENKTGAESVAKKKKKTKAEITAANIAEGIERKQLSFPQWCAKWGFSDSTGRNMIKAGVGPVLSGVGRLVFVTVEDDAKWWGMWSQEGGRERFKRWSREQRKLRD